MTGPAGGRHWEQTRAYTGSLHRHLPTVSRDARSATSHIRRVVEPGVGRMPAARDHPGASRSPGDAHPSTQRPARVVGTRFERLRVIV